MSYAEDNEIWKECYQYEGLYEVSNFGRVRSLGTYRKRDGVILSPWSQNKGYMYITLSKKSKRRAHAIHKLVLESFGFIRPNGTQCAHYDGDVKNNKLSNLRWTTSKNNHADRIRHGRVVLGDEHPSAKLNRKVVKTIKRLKGLVSATELANLACVSCSTIESIWKGETWKHVSEE